MNFASILSLGASGLAALLSLIMLFRGGSNLTLQSELQKRTQDIQTQQQEIEQQKQIMQRQQETVNTAQQLAQQAGPQVIANLKIAGTRSKNQEIFLLLTKYGVQTTQEEKDQINKLLEDEKAKAKEKTNGASKPPVSPAPAVAPAN